MCKPLIIPVFIPHFGCKHSCVFCNQKKIAGDYALPAEDELYREVISYRTSCPDIARREVQLAFYGGSFTGMDEEIQKTLLQPAAHMKDAGLLHKIRLSTRPDYIDAPRLALLEQYHVDIIELGVQSMDDEVLMAAQRGHTAADVLRAVALIGAWPQFALGLQMMIALPGDTPQKSLATARRIAELAPDFVRIYPTAVIKDTPLASQWASGAYQVWPWEEMLDTSAGALDIFQSRAIPVIRIGLQATDNLCYGQDLLAGAYHPALGEMVKSRLFRQKIAVLCRARHTNAATLFCHRQDLSQIIGQHRCNVDYFKRELGIELTVAVDDTLARGDFYLQDVSNDAGI